MNPLFWFVILVGIGSLSMDQFLQIVNGVLQSPFAQPGVFLVSHFLQIFDIPVTEKWQYLIAGAAAIYIDMTLWMVPLRWVWAPTSKWLGLYNPDHYHLWLWLPWRPVMRLWTILRDWWEDVFSMGRSATAKWTSFMSMLTHVYKPGQVFLGKLWAAGIGCSMPVGIPAERHLVMIAGSGSGKSTLLMTLLALHKGNSFVIDPKGQVAKALKRRCGKGGHGIIGKGMTVAVLDPYQIVDGTAQSCWNVFDELSQAELREGPEVVVLYAFIIAEGLIKQDDHSKPYFAETARLFIVGLVLHIYTTEPTYNRNLVRLRTLLNTGYPEAAAQGFDFLLDSMMANTRYDGVICNAAATLMNAGINARGDVLSTARQQTSFLDLPQVRRIIQHSDFHLGSLKTGKLNLIVCAPVGAIQGELAQFFRLLTLMGMKLFENIPGKLKYPCLFAIDEMPSLGNIPVIETAAPVMRSYGIRLLAITQDIERLKQAYPQAWGGFIGNAEIVWWMGTNHEATVSELEKTLGTRTRKEAVGGGRPKKGAAQFTHVERPLMYRDQIKRFLDPYKNNMIVTRFGKRPMRLKNAPYFKELPVAFYESDRDYRESLLRKFTRSIFKLLSPKERISRAEALQIFGLSDPFSERELADRYQLLRPACHRSQVFAQKVEQAYSLLRRNFG